MTSTMIKEQLARLKSRQVVGGKNSAPSSILKNYGAQPFAKAANGGDIYTLAHTPNRLLDLGGRSETGIVGDSWDSLGGSGSEINSRLSGDSMYPSEMLTRILEPVVANAPMLAGMRSFEIDDTGGWRKISKLNYFTTQGEVGLFCCGAVPKSTFSQQSLLPTPAGIHTFATSFDVCVLDLLYGLEHGNNYGGLTEETLKFKAAYETICQFQEHLIFEGEPSLNIYGLKNNPNIIRMRSPIRFDESATSEQIESVLRSVKLAASVASGGTSMPLNAGILPIGMTEYLASRNYACKPGSVLGNFFANSAFDLSRFEESVAANNLGDGGSRAVVLFVDAPDYVQVEVPFPLGVVEPHWTGVNLEYILLTHMGSVHVKRPGAMIILSGV
jgi:hypothetical protein